MKREELWKDLWKIKTREEEGSWIIIGDFNKIRHVDDKIGRGVFEVEGANKFNEVIEDIRLKEMRSTRGYYTWTNGSSGSNNLRPFD